MSLLDTGRRAGVVMAAQRWRRARMAMINANMKQNNRDKLDELSGAEDLLSKAVAELEESEAAMPKPTHAEMRAEFPHLYR